MASLRRLTAKHADFKELADAAFQSPIEPPVRSMNWYLSVGYPSMISGTAATLFQPRRKGENLELFSKLSWAEWSRMVGCVCVPACRSLPSFFCRERFERHCPSAGSGRRLQGTATHRGRGWAADRPRALSAGTRWGGIATDRMPAFVLGGPINSCPMGAVKRPGHLTSTLHRRVRAGGNSL